jgi:hypothetical protein
LLAKFLPNVVVMTAVQFKPRQQIDGESVSSRPDMTPSGVERVQVWFGAHVVADYVADSPAVERYAEAMRQRFAGLRVTCERAESPGASKPLPSERLWELTP